MAVLERHIQTVRCGPAAYWERERHFLAAEARIGAFPPKGSPASECHRTVQQKGGCSSDCV
jgi:hypothetical protein